MRHPDDFRDHDAPADGEPVRPRTPGRVRIPLRPRDGERARAAVRARARRRRAARFGLVLSLLAVTTGILLPHSLLLAGGLAALSVAATVLGGDGVRAGAGRGGPAGRAEHPGE